MEEGSKVFLDVLALSLILLVVGIVVSIAQCREQHTNFNPWGGF